MASMRLDKFLTECGICSRSEAARAAKLGLISLNGTAEKDPSRHIDPENDEICFRGEQVIYRRFTYIMLNKPAGFVSATEDPRKKTVLELLDAREQKRGLFPCGRLDIDTVGLLILTNDGALAHRLLSPKHHAAKEYRFECALPLGDLTQLEQGIALEDGYVTLPCRIRQETETSGVITLTEGKYHQIKRMFGAVGNRVVKLERISFAGILLDPALARGESRLLTEDEIRMLREAGC